MEDCFQERTIAFAGLLSLDLENAPGRPRQHRRIYITEVPFISGDLPVRMLIPFANNTIQLTFGNMRID